MKLMYNFDSFSIQILLFHRLSIFSLFLILESLWDHPAHDALVNCIKFYRKNKDKLRDTRQYRRLLGLNYVDQALALYTSTHFKPMLDHNGNWYFFKDK